jgi:CYTH domain-containing protein
MAKMRTAGDEAVAPKYAHVERERRWLVDPARLRDFSGLRSVRIEDRYLSGTRLRLRRMTDSATGAQALKLTKKYESDDPLARAIVTAYLSAAEYEVLCAADAAVVIKRRFAVGEDATLLSVDRFDDRLSGLVLAEIECADEQTLRAVSAPGWTVREVSADPRYQGGALALHGIPKD